MKGGGEGAGVVTVEKHSVQLVRWEGTRHGYTGPHCTMCERIPELNPNFYLLV